MLAVMFHLLYPSLQRRVSHYARKTLRMIATFCAHFFYHKVILGLPTGNKELLS